MKHLSPESLLLMLAAGLALGSCSSEPEAPAEQPEGSAETVASEPSGAGNEAAPGAQTSPAESIPPKTTEAKAPAPSETKPAVTAEAKAELQAPAPTAATALVRAAPDAFRQCAVCHSAARDAKHKIGPNLFGVVGRAAATSEGYNYSSALAASDLVWTLDNLGRYIEAPAQVVPGTKMVFPGQKDPAKRREIMEYLASLK